MNNPIQRIGDKEDISKYIPQEYILTDVDDKDAFYITLDKNEDRIRGFVAEIKCMDCGAVHPIDRDALIMLMGVKPAVKLIQEEEKKENKEKDGKNIKG